MDFDAAERLHHLARVALVPRDEPADDLDAALIARRRTSRLPYDGRTVPAEVLALLDADRWWWPPGRE